MRQDKDRVIHRAMGRISGDIAVMPIADVVIWLANRGHAGRLTVESEGVEKTFDIEPGMVTRATSNAAREYFGQFLLHFGLLTEDQLERAFETQRETGVLLGRILVMIGIVPEEQVIQSLRVKISESLLACCRWRTGRFEFVGDAPKRTEAQIEVAVPLRDLFSEGTQREEVWRRFEIAFPSPSHVAIVDEARVRTEAIDAPDRRLLELCRSGLSVSEMTLELHATDYQIAAGLLGLYERRMIAPAEPTTDLPVPGTFREDAVSTTHRAAVPQVVREPSYDERRALSAKQRYVLGRVDGKRTVQAIIEVSPMHDLEALQILDAFVRDQLVRID